MSGKKVLIIGAGFGGLATARTLIESDPDAEVTIIDQRNHHTFQPLLYQVATAGIDASDVCYPTRRFTRTNSAMRAIQGEAIAIDAVAKVVRLADGSTVAYDAAVLAMGAVTADFGVPGVADHAFGLKSAADAETLRQHVLSAFATAANVERRTGEHPVHLTTIVVVGGGPTGVEMAGGYAELTKRVLLADYPELDPDNVRIILVEGRDRLLNGFVPKLGENAHRTLEAMGVEVKLHAAVERVEASSVHFTDGSSVDTATVVWAAGVRAHSFARDAGFDVDRSGRVFVDEHLRVPGVDDLYAIGDLAAMRWGDQYVPQVAPGAIQAGEYVARHIAQIDDSDEPFEYRDKGSMATIGRNAAVVELPNGLTVTGFAGWVAWLGLHLVMLMGFRNRASVFVNWAWNYLTYDRGSRVVIETDDAPARAEDPTVER